MRCPANIAILLAPLLASAPCAAALLSANLSGYVDPDSGTAATLDRPQSWSGPATTVHLVDSAALSVSGGASNGAYEASIMEVTPPAGSHYSSEFQTSLSATSAAHPATNAGYTGFTTTVSTSDNIHVVHNPDPGKTNLNGSEVLLRVAYRVWGRVDLQSTPADNYAGANYAVGSPDNPAFSRQWIARTPTQAISETFDDTYWTQPQNITLAGTPLTYGVYLQTYAPSNWGGGPGSNYSSHIDAFAVLWDYEILSLQGDLMFDYQNAGSHSETFAFEIAPNLNPAALSPFAQTTPILLTPGAVPEPGTLSLLLLPLAFLAYRNAFPPPCQKPYRSAEKRP